MAELKKPSWDNAEIAFILNWSDYCIRCGGNYKTDILTELYRLPRADDFSPIQRTWAAVSSKLYQLLRCINNITPATLFRDGTSCLDVQKIPDNILREMNKQRAEWEFELLEKEEVNVPVVLGDVLMGEFVEDSGPGDDREASSNEQFHPAHVPRAPSWSGRPAMIPGAGRSARVQPRLTVAPTISPLTSAGGEIGALEDREANTGMRHEIERPSVPNEALSARIDCLFDFVGWVAEKMVSTEVVDSSALSDRLKMVKNILNRAPGTALSILMDDLVATDESRKRYRDELHTLIAGGTGALTQTCFPAIPHPKKLDEHWKAIRKGISAMIGYGDELGMTLQPSLPPGYLAARVDDLLDNHFPEREVNGLLKKLTDHRTTSCELQMLLGALVCRWAFVSPEPVCGGQLPLQTMSLYENIRLVDGLSSVKRLDFVATKLLFGREAFQKDQVRRRSEGLLKNIAEAIAIVHPAAPGPAFLGHAFSWAHRIVLLKQALMLSPTAYRIHFCFPGTAYDPTWMQAVNNEGRDCDDGRFWPTNVRLCLFPALAEQAGSTLPHGANIRNALVSHKIFFPSHDERITFNPNGTISKAVVLLERGAGSPEKSR